MVRQATTRTQETYDVYAMDMSLTHVCFRSPSACLLRAPPSVTDGEDAEVVSMKILEILLECLRCSAGEYLTDQAVLDMITECFHVRSQQHSSKLLRRYAENVLTQMVLVLFARIRSAKEGRGSDAHTRTQSDGHTHARAKRQASQSSQIESCTPTMGG